MAPTSADLWSYVTPDGYEHVSVEAAPLPGLVCRRPWFGEQGELGQQDRVMTVKSVRPGAVEPT